MKALKIKHSTYREYIVKRRAKVLHYCSECGKDIVPGEEYYQDNFAPLFGIGGFRIMLQDQSWTQKKICENCWKGVKLVA